MTASSHKQIEQVTHPIRKSFNSVKANPREAVANVKIRFATYPSWVIVMDCHLTKLPSDGLLTSAATLTGGHYSLTWTIRF